MLNKVFFSTCSLQLNTGVLPKEMLSPNLGGGVRLRLFPKERGKKKRHKMSHEFKINHECVWRTKREGGRDGGPRFSIAAAAAAACLVFIQQEGPTVCSLQI